MLIYLDNAATTYPKPIAVSNSACQAVKLYGANPGRSGHNMSIRTAEEIFKCRQAIKNMFNADSEENIVFTLNCTHAINTVLKGYLKPGDHVVISSLEHNAVVRPLAELAKHGITYSVAPVIFNDNDATVDSFRRAINASTRLIACTHASNVWGARLPVERLTALAHQYGIRIMVDAAQTAGIFPVDLQNDRIDFLCMAGHKGLYGTMGTGVLITSCGDKLGTIIEGGTGTSSQSQEQPSYMPEKFESGTPNVPGIIALKSGVEFVMNRHPENIANHEMKLILRLYDRLSENKNVKLYTPRPSLQYFAPVLSFNIKNTESEAVADYLNKNGQIAVRAGLHCAPLAHESVGTSDIGAVRISPSIFNNSYEIDRLSNLIQKIRINL